MTRQDPPRILDASALVELFAGHPKLMRMLTDAEAGRVFLLVPTLAIAEAQAAIGATGSMWDRILGLPGVRAMDLTQHVAVEAGELASARLRHHPMQAALIGPLMVGQVVYEAMSMNATIVTGVPEAYGGQDVAVVAI